MEYIIVSDLHEDIESLKKILNFHESERKAYITLGDSIGISKKYYPDVINDANACLSFMKSNNFIGVRGNHDNFHLKIIPKQTIFLYPEYLYNSKDINQDETDSKVWSFSDEEPSFLTQENSEYLRNFEEYIIKGNTLFSHFLFPDVTGSVKIREINIRQLIDIHFLYMGFNNLSISFVGHLHVREVQIISNKRGRLIMKEPTFHFNPESENEKFIVFCPSVIQNSIYMEYNDREKFINVKKV